MSLKYVYALYEYQCDVMLCATHSDNRPHGFSLAGQQFANQFNLLITVQIKCMLCHLCSSPDSWYIVLCSTDTYIYVPALYYLACATWEAAKQHDNFGIHL